jgi:hypothetical protein
MTSRQIRALARRVARETLAQERAIFVTILRAYWHKQQEVSA